VSQITRSPSNDSTDADSDSLTSIDAASAWSTEPKDATYPSPVAILSRLVELSFEPIIVWDWHSGIVAWNYGCEQLYGYSRSESMGCTSHKLLQTRFPQPFAEIEQLGTWNGELRHLTRAGSEIIVENRWQLTRIGERTFVLETNRDITERKAAQEALWRANYQKDEFLAMLAHELRNPLAPIRNAAVLLSREIGADSRLGMLTAMITRQSQHLTRLLDDLLDVSRIARGRIVQIDGNEQPPPRYPDEFGATRRWTTPSCPKIAPLATCLRAEHDVAARLRPQQSVAVRSQAPRVPHDNPKSGSSLCAGDREAMESRSFYFTALGVSNSTIWAVSN
jgi:PAS domain S-box-containing protein